MPRHQINILRVQRRERFVFQIHQLVPRMAIQILLFQKFSERFHRLEPRFRLDTAASHRRGARHPSPRAAGLLSSISLSSLVPAVVPVVLLVPALKSFAKTRPAEELRRPSFGVFEVEVHFLTAEMKTYLFLGAHMFKGLEEGRTPQQGVEEPGEYVAETRCDVELGWMLWRRQNKFGTVRKKGKKNKVDIDEPRPRSSSNYAAANNILITFGLSQSDTSKEIDNTSK